MDAINFRNYVKLKKSFKDIPALEKELREKATKLVESLRKKIEIEIQGSGWDLVDKDKVVQITDDKKHRGSIFVAKKGVDYKIGIEHFNPNFEEDKDKRDDYIFCGRFNKEWSGKKYISDYKGVKMRVNSMEYVILLLTENIDDLVSHFFEEFKTYFNNNK